jgi:drug/metabolite transporter (DMT)-like permease
VSDAEASPASRGQNIAAFIVLSLVWGSTWLVIKDQISVVPPAWSVTWRFLIAGTVTLAICALRGERLALPAEAMRLAAAIGLFQFVLNFQLVYASELHVTSGLVAVIFALMLVPNALMARFFLKIPIGGRFMAGSAVALAGAALLMAHEYRAAPAGMNVIAGFALAGAALLSASTANILQVNQVARRTPIMPLVGWSMLIGALGDAAYAWAAYGPPQIDPRPQYWLGVAYLALIGTVLTWPLYARLLRDWGPGKAAYNGVAVPVVAMALSTLFEGYVWTGLAVGGAVLAMIGLLIALSGRKADG